MTRSPPARGRFRIARRARSPGSRQRRSPSQVYHPQWLSSGPWYASHSGGAAPDSHRTSVVAPSLCTAGSYLRPHGGATRHPDGRPGHPCAGARRALGRATGAPGCPFLGGCAGARGGSRRGETSHAGGTRGSVRRRRPRDHLAASRGRPTENPRPLGAAPRPRRPAPARAPSPHRRGPAPAECPRRSRGWRRRAGS